MKSLNPIEPTLFFSGDTLSRFERSHDMVLKVQEDVVRIVHRPPLATTGCLNCPRFALEENCSACLQAVAADSHSCASQIW